MISDVAFSEGLTRIGIAVRQPADGKTQAVYFDALEHQTDAQEWAKFTRTMVAAGRWTWFPKVAEILEALREFRGVRPLLAEANEAHERVLNSAGYSPECGAVWTYRSVKESCGPAAAEAFLVAGGHNAFATTWDETKRRERFIEAYQNTVTVQPETALLPAASQKLLQSAEQKPGPLSQEEAVTAYKRLKSMVPSIPDEKPKTVEVTDERLAALRRQAEEIQAVEVK